MAVFCQAPAAVYTETMWKMAVARRATLVSLAWRLVLGAAGVAVVVGLFFSTQAAVYRSGEVAARLMAPPAYPGSVRVGLLRNPFDGYVQEVSTYETSDDAGQVVAYFSEHYEPAIAPDALYTTWRVGISPLNAVDWLGLGPTVRPKASVAVQAITERAVTQIRVILVWPVVRR